MISRPTLLLWAAHDPALDIANAEHEKLLRWVPDLRVELLDTSHWVLMDLPQVVNSKLLAFLTTEEPA